MHVREYTCVCERLTVIYYFFAYATAMSPKNTPEADANIPIRLTMGRLKALIATEVKKELAPTNAELAATKDELAATKAELAATKAELAATKARLKIVERRLNQYELIIFERQEASLVGKNGARIAGRQHLRNKLRHLDEFHAKMHARNLANSRKNELKKIAGNVYASRAARRSGPTSSARESNDLGSMNTAAVRNAAIATGAIKQKRSASGNASNASVARSKKHKRV